MQSGIIGFVRCAIYHDCVAFNFGTFHLLHLPKHSTTAMVYNSTYLHFCHAAYTTGCLPRNYCFASIKEILYYCKNIRKVAPCVHGCILPPSANYYLIIIIVRFTTRTRYINVLQLNECF